MRMCVAPTTPTLAPQDAIQDPTTKDVISRVEIALLALFSLELIVKV